MSARVAAIVLAAGSSQRFGSDNKLLERVGERTLIARAVDAVQTAGADPIVVVTGHDRDGCHSALAGHRVSFAHNADHATGMGSSIAVGASALDGVDAVLIALGDMPLVAPEMVRKLVEAFDSLDRRAREAICVPVFEGRRGHPVLFGVHHLQALRALDGERGARSLLGANPGAVVEIRAPDAGVLCDVDTAADLRTVRSESV